METPIATTTTRTSVISSRPVDARALDAGPSPACAT